MAIEHCKLCDMIIGKKPIRGGTLIRLGNGWVLGHFSEVPKAYLGRLFLFPEAHRDDFASLTEIEARALGIYIKRVQTVLQGYWRNNFQDELYRLYVIHFNENKENL